MNDYYKSCGIPKPITKKKHKKQNGYKNKPYRYCYYCKTNNAECHEVFGGSSRQISIDMGFQVNLCKNCHGGWHAQKEQIWIERKKEWQLKYQLEYEAKLIESGVSKKQAREIWKSMIGKNHTDEIV
ncbi:hypothetical protein [Anaerovorax sp. IOR16]|uniref:hypothetical protein n=1 Tax=Anaerovorax sp. IOR16 TaxID=2773458 RepID=UPI0019D2971B|nr:hypothetical protein [Anaerovorax sp. IOR16]